MLKVPKQWKEESKQVLAACADEQLLVSSDSLILIVDHYRFGQRIALLQLNHLGLSAHVVTSCRQAMKAINKCPYALVLIGWGMPTCDGAGFTNFVRRLDKKDASPQEWMIC